MNISCLTVTQPRRLRELERCIRCFSRQTYADKEMVIIHDAGDGFQRDLERLREQCGGGKRVRILCAENQLPLGALRNLAVKHALGDIVCQWDDDDLYHPARLETQLQRLVDTGSDFCFFTDQLHWFENTGEFYWDDWNVEPYPGNLIQGTLMGRRDKMPEYPALSHGEDTPVLRTLFERSAKLVALEGYGYLYIYTFTGKNAWDFPHHRAISRWKALRKEELETKRDELTRNLRDYELPLSTARFPHDTGEMVIELEDPA